VERAKAMAFLRSGESDGVAALASFCHVLVNLNEFVYRP
jgi:hypothetical protein